MLVSVDFETYSAVSVTRVGAEPYAAHRSTGLHCAVWRFFDVAGDHQVLRWSTLEPVDLEPVWAHVRAGGKLLAHNAGFEAAILRHVAGPALGWLQPAPDQWIDTAAQASLLALPASLEALAGRLGAEVQKDMEGSALMKSLMHAVPDGAGGWGPPPVTPEQMRRLLDYCDTDTRAAIACLRRLPPLPAIESRLLPVDRKINARGARIDLEFAHQMRRMVRARSRELSALVCDATGGDQVSVAPAPLKNLLLDHGIEVPSTVVTVAGQKQRRESLDAAAIRTMLERTDLPDPVRVALDARLEDGRTTSLAKLKVLDELVGADMRLRGALRYCGAQKTGRWSSKGLQVHNLPRNRMKAPVWAPIEAGLRAAIRDGDLEAAKRAAPNLLECMSLLLRSLIVAAPGHDLIGADYSAIEARVIAWLAGEQGVLDIFTSGRDIYVEDAARVGSDNRQLGKVQRLALGYGMGVLQFIDAAAGYGVVVAPKEARKIVKGWRDNNPAIVQFWADLQEAWVSAVRSPGVRHKVGFLTVIGGQSAVRILLPSGRALHYWSPRIAKSTRRISTVDDDGEIVERDIEMMDLRFLTADSGDMMQDHTYGGKLAENVTQAVARDLMAEALVRLDTTPYNVVLHVHDSIVSEVPSGTGDVNEFGNLISVVPAWAPGLPVAAEGYRSQHFKG